jgi:hypothetical protein
LYGRGAGDFALFFNCSLNTVLGKRQEMVGLLRNLLTVTACAHLYFNYNDSLEGKMAVGPLKNKRRWIKAQIFAQRASSGAADVRVCSTTLTTMLLLLLLLLLFLF